MLDKGTADHSARQIAEYFDSIGGQLTMSAGRFTVFGSATTLREDFPAAAGAVRRVLHPADVSRRTSSPRSSSLPWAPSPAGPTIRTQEISELFCDNLPADSPYHVIQGGKAETRQDADRRGPASSTTPSISCPNNMVVTVFGDIDPDEALALVEAAFRRL